MTSWIFAGALVMGGCGFQADFIPQDGGIAGPSRPPGAPGTGEDVLHVGPADEYIGIDDLTIAAPITIDTGAMSFGMALPPGVTFAAASQDGSGPELAILHVRALTVHADVRAFGARPLVVLASSFDLDHMIDVSAHDNEGGPGALSAQAPQTSGDGRAHVLAGGAPGTASPSLLSCSIAPPGAGGGAIEVYAHVKISISGYINAGGGTGGTGICLGIVIAPNPDGSGGTIVLQSPVVENSGRLSASGGGGGLASGAVGGGSDGQILMLYRTKVAAGNTTPKAITQPY
jgi:hypothetical protein